MDVSSVCVTLFDCNILLLLKIFLFLKKRNWNSTLSYGFVYFHMDPIFYHSFDGWVDIHMPWISIRRGVLVIISPQIHSTKPELRFCTDLNPSCGVSEIRDGEDLWQFSRLEIRLNVFRRSTIPQKQFNSSYLFTILERMFFKILPVSLLFFLTNIFHA